MQLLYYFKAAITQVVSKLTKIANRLKQLMTREFDVLVIGTGTSGYTLALACREAGRSVAVADNGPTAERVRCAVVSRRNIL
jgi:hypothetical protein